MNQNLQATLDRHAQALNSYGFTVIGVFDPQGETPSFNYIDQDRALPFSLIVVGLHPQIGHQILTAARRELLGRELTDVVCLGERVELRETANMPAWLVPAPPNIAAGATAYHGDGPVWQVIWPDTRGRFPWDGEMDARMCWMQGWGEWNGRARLNLGAG